MEGRLTHNPKDQLALLTMALLYEKAKDYANAKTTYERLLKINPEFSDAQNNLAYLYAEHFGELDQAYELAQSARQRRPHEAPVADTLGWVLFKQGDYPGAAVLLNESARQLPDDADVHFHLGMAYYLMGKEEPARKAFQRAVDSGKDFAGQNEAQRCLKMLAIDQAAIDAATVTTLEQASNERPADPVVALRLGAFYESQNAWNQARSTYERTLKSNPKAVPVLHQLALLHLRHFHNDAKAFELEKTAHDLDADDPNVAHTLGRLAFDARDYEWALSLQVVAASKLGEQAEVAYDLGRSYYSVGRVPEATAQMNKALQLNQDFPQANDARRFVSVAALFQEPDQARAAEAHVQELLKAEPDYVPALMALGVIARQQGDSTAAKRTFEKVLARYPLFAPADQQLAKLYFQAPVQEQKAYDHALKAYGAFPGDAEVAKILGILTSKHGDHRRAVQILQTAARKRPTDAELLFHLGMAHYRLGETEECRAAIKKAQALDTNATWFAEATRVLAELK